MTAAAPHDPEAGLQQPCPCHTRPAPAGTARDWHKNKGPGPLLSARHGTPPGCYRSGSWIDHPYRLRRVDGRWAYVAEPYRLSSADFADLAYLHENGFDVNVNAWKARHFPGRTIAVTITPRAA